MSDKLNADRYGKTETETFDVLYEFEDDIDGSELPVEDAVPAQLSPQGPEAQNPAE